MNLLDFLALTTTERRLALIICILILAALLHGCYWIIPPL